eukprot:TRINITY_DN416_c0_g1_i3.p1 TRINITY_DN416_c0_g1~~TRINITY_DN416_c0_g1_i3.p1  ORF type:complete len:372 (-),score=89.79 TRINITY_DN416_c0_g1_i3:37-1152(-)
MKATIREIVEASTQPLSIVIVGIGNDEFENMDELDADDKPLMHKGKEMNRDIVQFVPFRKFKNHPERLAAETLMEIPAQLTSFMSIAGIAPLAAPQVWQGLRAPQGGAGVPTGLRPGVPLSGVPPQQGGFPPQQSGFPPQQGGFPSQQGGFPSQQGGFPSQQGGFPSQQGGFPPQQGGTPQQGGFPPQQGGTAQQGGFPPQQSGTPQQGGFPPQQGGAPQQGGFPPQQGGSPQQGGFPPQQGGSSQQRGFPPQQATPQQGNAQQSRAPTQQMPAQGQGFPQQQSQGFPPQQAGMPPQQQQAPQSQTNDMLNKLDPQLRELLQSLHYEEYAKIFVNEDLNYEALQEFDKSDMKELGLPAGPRIAIYKRLHSS